MGFRHKNYGWGVDALNPDEPFPIEMATLSVLLDIRDEVMRINERATRRRWWEIWKKTTKG